MKSAKKALVTSLALLFFSYSQVKAEDIVYMPPKSKEAPQNVDFMFDRTKMAKEHIEIAKREREKKRWENAAKAYERAYELDPSALNADDLMMLAAHYSSDSWNAEKAIELLNKAIQLEPSNAELYSMLGTIHYSRTSNTNSAINAFKKAIELEPKNTLHYSQLADCYVRSKRFDEAATLYRKILEINPDNGLAKKSLDSIIKGEHPWYGGSLY